MGSNGGTAHRRRTSGRTEPVGAVVVAAVAGGTVLQQPPAFMTAFAAHR